MILEWVRFWVVVKHLERFLQGIAQNLMHGHMVIYGVHIRFQPTLPKCYVKVYTVESTSGC